MRRVAALYLPEWPIERSWRMERSRAPRPDLSARDAHDGLAMIAEGERGIQCSVPRGGGWRPGARWSRAEIAEQIAAMPAHQRPPLREMGRRSEAADHPFRAMRSDDAGRTPHADVMPSMPTSDAAPLVMQQRDVGRFLVASVSASARALGVYQGMAIASARALNPGLVVRDADPDGDHAHLQRLATALARRWAPTVAVSDDRGMFLDLTGVAHLHGGEAAMMRRIIRLLARIGFTARIAVADTAGAAWALVRFHADAAGATPMICPTGAHRAMFAPLLPAALRLDAATCALLHRFGIASIGALAEMPHAPLARRFGRLLVIRLGQAAGDIAEPFDAVIPIDPIVVVQRFAEPIATAEAIEHWLALLVARMTTALAQQGQGARAVLLLAERVDNVPQTLRIGLARPSRDPAHILRLMVRRIEQIEPGFGIDALALHVLRSDPLGPEAMAETLDHRTPDLSPLIDTLANRAGAGRLWRSRPVESDVPERSVASIAPLDPPEREEPALKASDVRRLDLRAPLHPWHPRWPRPIRILARPEPIDNVIAELPDHPPRRFSWRGRTHRVVRADGPERIHSEWWKRSSERDAVRDYFRVENENGERFWLFRRGDGMLSQTGDLSWFLHGWFG